jgi:hypothetical protein
MIASRGRAGRLPLCKRAFVAPLHVVGGASPRRDEGREGGTADALRLSQE